MPAASRKKVELRQAEPPILATFTSVRRREARLGRKRGGRGRGEVGCARAVRPDWATFSGAGSTMFSRAGVAGVSAWAVQPQWYGSLRSGRERCEGRRSSVRGKRRRVEATETNRGRGPAGPPVPRRPQEAPRPREGARSDCRDCSHATSPGAG